MHLLSWFFESFFSSFYPLVSNPIIMGVRFRPKLMSEVNLGSGSFCPGGNRRGVETPPSFFDAADHLAQGTLLPSGASGPGVLLTADGGRYTGTLFGAQQHGEGELVFTNGYDGVSRIPDRSILCRSSSHIHISTHWQLWCS